jgi:putative ABC transport system substrate-binding protein
MKRREFITLLGGTVAWPLTGRAQQPDQVRRIGVLMVFGESDAEGQARFKSFVEELEKLGRADGRKIQIDAHWPGGDAERLRTNAAQLVSQKPDAILVSGTTALLALRRETRSIPIVFFNVADPVADGLVESLARPGGNITGFSNFENNIGGKWVEALKEVAPQVSRILVIFHPANAAASGQLRALDVVASSLGVQTVLAGVNDAADIERAIKTFRQDSNGGILVLPDSVIGVHRQRIIEMAANYRLPAIYPLRYFVTSGGLMSYGVDTVDSARRAASYVDRILKGEKPGDLPVQTPVKYEFVINLKTAKTLGITIPPTLLARADEVIE